MHLPAVLHGLTIVRRLAIHEEKKNKHKKEDVVPDGAVPAYLMDREGVSRAKVHKRYGSRSR